MLSLPLPLSQDEAGISGISGVQEVTQNSQPWPGLLCDPALSLQMPGPWPEMKCPSPNCASLSIHIFFFFFFKGCIHIPHYSPFHLGLSRVAVLRGCSSLWCPGSHRNCFPPCRAQALGTRASAVAAHRILLPAACGIFLKQEDRAHVPCIGRQGKFFIHCSAREV